MVPTRNRMRILHNLTEDLIRAPTELSTAVIEVTKRRFYHEQNNSKQVRQNFEFIVLWVHIVVYQYLKVNVMSLYKQWRN